MRFVKLQASLAKAEANYCGNACVYATGSYGRGESSGHSDLDLFILGGIDRDAGNQRRMLSNLDEICLKASLIQATRDRGFQEFSGDGEYLTHYTINDLVGSLGQSDDDARNTFTARLLLLLESKAVLGDTNYQIFVSEVLNKYWRDFGDHQSSFKPAFLANDILRLWRTFCVNYEARTADDPPEKKAKRKLKNYKLKHSRMLTCYSALLYLLAVFRTEGTVKLHAAEAMAGGTPTERIEALEQLMGSNWTEEMSSASQQLLEIYENFLRTTDQDEQDLLILFKDEQAAKEHAKKSYAFGDQIFKLIELIGAGNDFHRLLVV